MHMQNTMSVFPLLLQTLAPYHNQKALLTQLFLGWLSLLGKECTLHFLQSLCKCQEYTDHRFLLLLDILHYILKKNVFH